MKSRPQPLFILLTIIVFLFPAVSFSEQPDPKIWESIGYNSYYNKKIIRKTTDIPLFWTYKTITDDAREKRVTEVKNYDVDKSIKYKDYHHEVVLWDIDCNKKLIRMKEYIDFDREGKVIDRYRYDHAQWGSIVPKSKGDTLYCKVCLPQQEPLKKKKKRKKK